MGPTDDECAELRIRIAKTLATRSRSDVYLALEQFDFPITEEECRETHSGGELEERILKALESDSDVRRLEDLDYDLHARGLADDLTDELEAERSIPGAPASFYSVIMEKQHYLIFEETRSRIKAIRTYLELLESAFERELNLVTPTELYQEARRRKYPYLKHPSIDFDDVARSALLAKEFPLVAWGPTFIYCFTVLERFLKDAVSIAARLKHRPAPSSLPKPIIESRIGVLESFGFKLMLSPQTIQEISVLRPMRNRLVHELSLVANELPRGLDHDIHLNDEDVLPSPELGRRALRAVHDIVSAAETSFEMQASDAAMGWHQGQRQH